MRLLIVNYHYIREKKPQNGIHPLNLKEFIKQVDELAKTYQFISQEQLLDFIEKDEYPDKNFCLLTFDDGFKEQLAAFDILRKMGIGGIFFVITDPIQYHTVVEVHKLHYVRSVLEDKEIFHFLDREFHISEVHFDEALLADINPYDNKLARKVKYALTFGFPEKERIEAINALFREVVDDEAQFSQNLYFSHKDLKKLAKHNMLGTHSSSHRLLGCLEPDEIRKDISRSLKFLEDVVGSKVEGISYPYGRGMAMSDTVAEIAEELNLSFGISTFRGCNTEDDFRKERFLLKRMSTSEAPGGKAYNPKYCL